MFEVDLGQEAACDDAPPHLNSTLSIYFVISEEEQR